MDHYSSENEEEAAEVAESRQQQSMPPSPVQSTQIQPDYDQAFALLHHPKSVRDVQGLLRLLDALGVAEAEDLAELDRDDLDMLAHHLKKVSLKRFNRFLCL